MSFHDVDFPLNLAFGASGGPTRSVEIVPLASGQETRNTAQSRSRRRYNAVTGVKSLEDAKRLSEFFEARSGRLYGFRFRDPLDHSSGDLTPTSTDQTIGVGDGTTQLFQLKKIYGDVLRPISRPVIDTVKVAVDGLDVAVTHHPLGQIKIDPAPSMGAVITAGFLFDTPVRFDVDGLVLSLETQGAVSVADVPLIELFDDA